MTLPPLASLKYLLHPARRKEEQEKEVCLEMKRGQEKQEDRPR